MLKELVEHLMDAGRESADPIVTAPGEPGHVYYIRQTSGELKRTEAAPAPGKDTAFSLQAIIELATKHAPFSRVWYSPWDVRLVYGQDARSTVALDMSPSDQLAKLSEWKKSGRALSQAELVRDLRTTFRDSLGQAGNLVEILKKVNFRATAATEGEIGHGKASLGKTIAGEVTGAGIIPEYVKFDVPLYANACFRRVRQVVECALEPDAATGTFRVIPLPGQIEDAIDGGTRIVFYELQSSLKEAKVPIYFGKPG